MRNVLFILAIIIGNSINFSAQEIEMTKVFGGYKFMQNGKNITLNQMQEIMKDQKEAFDLVSSAKTNQTFGMILSTAGGALIGFPIGTAIGGGDPEWALAGAGAALIVASIPIVKSFNKKTKKAVELYNAGIKSTSFLFKPTFDLNLKGNAVGIVMTF